ncbi:hypothetical protein IC762_15370 [Bradyrhizobium genosp. L]|uniref:hypothetical protein n=1 Tax=Bradyrhizobium genosp. L TaxID=83637 RepID=UPI0018A29938|nr:hypothetical protein [Bradyrhizobium genosp. L]QPF87580.1 hypothetical protein IC762_15370 [Bradyrhizobium genosp. L]
MNIILKPKPFPPTGFSSQPGPGPIPPQASSSDAPAETATVASKPDKAISKAKAKVVKKPTVKREQSSIAFPYMDLDAAISVARSIATNGGRPHTRDQLAGAMNQSSLSGAFIMKLSAARQFGLVDLADGKFKLTDLGFSIVDKSEAREKEARVRAFLSVELYRKIYEEFKGKQLPPRPLGLEQTFVDMGVAPKQKTNARLAFDRSAKQAGFTSLDPDRLIEPMLNAVGNVPVAASVGKLEAPMSFGGGAGSAHLDPLIVGLLDRLPSPGKPWSEDKRRKWIQTLEANLEMIYPIDLQTTGSDDTP